MGKLRFVGLLGLVVIVVVLLVIEVFYIFGNNKKISSETINLEGKSLPLGIYYQYSLNDKQKISEEEVDVKLILEDLKQKNIFVEGAWYKPYSSSCCPPGQEEPVKCMPAVVEPVLIIKLEEETEITNFIKIDEPDIGWCAYYVKHYKLK